MCCDCKYKKEKDTEEVANGECFINALYDTSIPMRKNKNVSEREEPRVCARPPRGSIERIDVIGGDVTQFRAENVRCYSRGREEEGNPPPCSASLINATVPFSPIHAAMFHPDRQYHAVVVLLVVILSIIHMDANSCALYTPPYTPAEHVRDAYGPPGCWI